MTAVSSIAFLLCVTFGTLRCQLDDEDMEVRHQRLSEMMKWDGNTRVVVGTPKNTASLVKKSRILVVMFWVDNNLSTEKISESDRSLLEVAAQVFHGRGVAVATCEIRQNQEFAVKAGVRYTGMIQVFNHGKVTTYYGQRSVDVLVPYISRMLENPLTLINAKTEKKSFDNVELPKVIAYVKAESAAMKALHDAAQHFQPMIQFHVVTDAKVAKTFHLKKLNTLQFIKPFERAITFPDHNPLTEASIVDFIKENKKQRITKLRLENLHDIWRVDMKGYMIAIFAIAKHDDGSRLLAAVRQVAKKFESKDNLTFVWIDPDPFPTMRDYWRQAFEVDPSTPTIGAVDIHAQTSAWLKRDEEELTVKDISKWLEELLAGNIVLAPMKLAGVDKPPPPTGSRDVDQEEDVLEKDEL